MRTCYRKGDGDNTVVGEPQQLYKPMDLHDVQWPPTSSSGALLSRDATHALPDDRHVVCVVWARASASDTVQTICTVTDCCFHTETHLNDSTATSLEHYTDDGCCTHTESCWRSKIHSLVLNEKVVRTERRKDERVGGGLSLVREWRWRLLLSSFGNFKFYLESAQFGKLLLLLFYGCREHWLRYS